MPNYFIGELSEARLFDLVKPLVNGKKSGMLLIKGKDVGEIHIEGGKIIIPGPVTAPGKKPFWP